MIRRVFILVLLAATAGAAGAADDATRSKITARVVSAQTTLASDQSTLTLDDVVRTALAKNPAVLSAAHSVAAQRTKVPQARALPEPTFGIGWMGNPTPFSVQAGDPSSYRSVSAMQMLPFPGKRSLRGRIAGKESDASQWDLEAVRRRVVADVKASYYDYWYYDKALHTTEQNRDLLSTLSQIAEARYRVGKGMQADVLRSQVEISMLLQKLTTLEQQRATAQARLNTLLARDPDAPLPPAADVANPSPLNYAACEGAAKDRPSCDALHRLPAPVLQYWFHSKNWHHPARGAVLRHRRDLVPLSAELQHEHSRLGWPDRIARRGRGNGGFHVAVPRSCLQRCDQQGPDE